MVNEILYPKTELVQEIDNKYQVPSFEEFMKTYESDEEINESYEIELGSFNSKGYGPCIIN